MIRHKTLRGCITVTQYTHTWATLVRHRDYTHDTADGLQCHPDDLFYVPPITNCQLSLYSINRIFSQIFSPEYIMTFSLLVFWTHLVQTYRICFSDAVFLQWHSLYIRSLQSLVLLIQLPVSDVMLCTTNVLRSTAVSRAAAAECPGSGSVPVCTTWAYLNAWPHSGSDTRAEDIKEYWHKISANNPNLSHQKVIHFFTCYMRDTFVTECWAVTLYTCQISRTEEQEIHLRYALYDTQSKSLQ